MKFCFITTLYLSRHASMKRSLGMAPVLASLGHDVTLVMHDHPENKNHATSLPGVECVFVPAGGALTERRWKSRFLSSRPFDVIVYNSLCWRNAVRKNGASRGALALMEHCELESSNKGTSIIRRSAQSLLEWWSLFAFDGQICASRYLLDLFKRRTFILRRNQVIFWSPYAIDADVLALPAVQKMEQGRKKTVFHIGTMAKNYGCLFMLDGLRRLLDHRSDWEARFIGKGRDLETAKARALELGLQDHVTFAGYVPEDRMREELAGAAVFLSHLNDTEQDWARCPSKVYYYMAIRKPVVTSSIGENRVALGNDGFYYRSSDPQDFARALSLALDVPAHWAPAYTAESVTWRHRTKEFLRELEGLSFFCSRKGGE